MTNWFQRMTRGILTTSSEKKEIPADLWYKCPKCKKILPREEHASNLCVCSCGFHERISSDKYFNLLFDNKEYTELDANIFSSDPLNFVDRKRYTDRLQEAYQKTGLKDAITNAVGKVGGYDLVVSSMNFEFIGGSMGSVVGEKIARAIDYCIKHKFPLMIISRSGGARMMEAAFSLMQMAKTAAKLTQLADAKLPFISFMTDPTTGGVTASFSMLGDINIAEPGALIGFAGPRVIKQTIGKDLPEGFQTSEFLLEHGFLDYLVERPKLKETIALQLKMFRE
ncbi:MAG: acetyl-CoA carboxylase carboxyltransferase subunit beta [Bacteroidales bacterium]|nr:acetyl-CoA carboxylase carboxyltransferase subunit beta [Bacteroidales bacterium]